MAQIERFMFREYDIRGKMNSKELNPATAELIGKGYGTFLKKQSVDTAVVGHDSRHGSEDLKDAVARGLVSTGCNVIDIGMCLTPMMYWAQYHFE